MNEQGIPERIRKDRVAVIFYKRIVELGNSTFIDRKLEQRCLKASEYLRKNKCHSADELSAYMNGALRDITSSPRYEMDFVEGVFYELQDLKRE